MDTFTQRASTASARQTALIRVVYITEKCSRVYKVQFKEKADLSFRNSYTRYMVPGMIIPGAITTS